MLWKGYTPYASKFGKLSSGHGTGKGQFSFQSQRKEMPKNAHTTAQLHSSHMLAKWCSKFSKPGFNSTCTMNFQMFKLNLEKAEEPEIKLPTSIGSSKKQESSRKTSAFGLLTMPKPLIVWITTNCGKFLNRQEYQTTWPTSWDICIQISVTELIEVEKLMIYSSSYLIIIITMLSVVSPFYKWENGSIEKPSNWP